MSIDLRLALNALSDVVENRPLPLREFDQIYMKAGDLIVHAEFVARKFNGKRAVFVGDGDAVGLAVAHLYHEGLIEYGPASIEVLDFDERMVNSIRRFAADFQLTDVISARCYNVVEAIPTELLSAFDAFHINPPWGQHNEGASVIAFLERASQLIKVGGAGIVVIADGDRPWVQDVLHRTQEAALTFGLNLREMIPMLHAYHLPDAPDLRSCSMLFSKHRDEAIANQALSSDRMDRFYGRAASLRVQRIHDCGAVGRGTADPRSYNLIPLEGSREP